MNLNENIKGVSQRLDDINSELFLLSFVCFTENKVWAWHRMKHAFHVELAQ